MRALTGLSIRSNPIRRVDPATAAAAAAEVEKLGFDGLWISAGAAEGFEEQAEAILAATGDLQVATSVISIWVHGAAETAATWARLRSRFGPRLLAGVGVSHEAVVNQAGQLYSKPVGLMREYLDQLDAAPQPIPPGERVIGALGPRMLELAAARSAGAHPFLVPPEHTRQARAILGPDRLLVPNLKVVLEADPRRARSVALESMALHVTLANYLNNLRRYGFTDADFENGGSDRLIEAVVICGDEDKVLAAAQSHLDAGANQVALEVFTEDNSRLPLDEWRRLAAAAR